MASYIVKTWDPDLQRFTPQVGVPVGPHTLFGLRRPLRELQRLGYDTTRRDGHYVEVERVLHRVVHPLETDPQPDRDIQAHVLDVVTNGIWRDLQTT